MSNPATDYLQQSLAERALRASQDADLKTLHNLRSFALRAGHLNAETLSTVSAMINNALALRARGETIRSVYTEADALLWYETLTEVANQTPAYAQIALISLAATYLGERLPYAPYLPSVLAWCY
jgi:hypothetical protein